MSAKKIQIWLPLGFALTLVLGMFLGYKMKENMPSQPGFMFLNRKSPVQEVMDLIQKRYVDPVAVDSLGDQAIEEVLGQLDPHSVYIPASDLQMVNEDLAGQFEGIGIEFNILDDTVHVLNVIRGGPSEKAGLLVGDRFLKVGQVPIAGVKVTNDTIRRLLRGPRGSEVDVTLLRGSKPLTVTITRGIIPLYAVDASYIMRPGTGYIKINKFSETTYEEFMESLEKLQREQPLRELILDLRGNGGGILDEAVQMADEFLDGNKLIVYTEGAHMTRREYKCQRPGLFEDGKLVLLLDETSASASEVLAGALQDWDRATIIGRRSFGKGLVQEQYSLSDGSALRLTVARYYTPLGRSIQKSYENGIKQYNEELLDRFAHGALSNSDSDKVNKGKEFRTPGGKKVYEGGGITPDIFVAVDTSINTLFLDQLYSRNTLMRFSYHYYVDHRDQFSGFKDPGDFNRRFQVTDQLLGDLREFARRDSVNWETVTPADQAWISTRLKGLLARQVWRNEGYVRVSNAEDPVIRKALDILPTALN